MFHFFKSKNKIALILVGCASSISTQAQTTESYSDPIGGKETAPYSQYLLGEDVSGLNVAQRAQGYLSASVADPFTVNTDNPASYAWLRLITYELGLEGRSRKITHQNSSTRTGTTMFSYLNIGIPVNKNLAIAAGLKPIARTYYNFKDTTSFPYIGNASRSYIGDGGLNEVFLGLSGKVKNISIGVNAGYQFGNYLYEDRLNVLRPDTGATNSEMYRTQRFKGWHFTTGALYQGLIKNKTVFRVGATYGLGYNLKYSQSEVWRSTYGGNFFDTAVNSEQQNLTAKMPQNFSFGIQVLELEKWSLGADYKSSSWADFSMNGQIDSNAINSSKISFGLSYTPEYNNYYKYFRRVTYKAGAYFGNDKLKLRGEQLGYFAVTAGLSLPFKRFTDRVHTSFEWGQRGTLNNGLVKENYFRFGLSMSVNDRWFIKPKYD